jgi:phytanoyl-CoA hydroxylase
MSANPAPASFSEHEIHRFYSNGYLVVPQLIPVDYIETMKQITQRDLLAHQGEIEYEADVQYPGSPPSLHAAGGKTARRLRQAISRDPVFMRLILEPFLLNRIKQLLGPHIVMPLQHHNCIMTKQPQFSSDTGWHQDTRYWSFQSGELINIWIALGSENSHNGCLQLLPGTHRETAAADRLDQALFLRTDLAENQTLLKTAQTAELQAGDALFFHARCFHAATRNFSSETKRSVVFTFRPLTNPPLPGSKSAQWPELLLP